MDDDPRRPRVTVVDPAGGSGAAEVLAAAPAARRRVLALVALALLVPVGLSGVQRWQQASQDRAARELVREARSLHLSLVGWSAGPAPTLGTPVVDATVRLAVRNDGPRPVRLLAGRLDGAPPQVAVGPAPVAPGTTAAVVASWRVLCAEVGTLDGPRALVLDVAPVDGRRHPVALGLRPARDSFREAAVAACG